MNDNETMDLIRERMSSLDMTTPVEAILTRGDIRRKRRRFARLGATGLVIAGLAVGVPAFTGSAAPAPEPTGPVELVAFSVTRNPDGTATLRLPKRQVLDPATLQRALADAGVPAIVRIGSFCRSDGAGRPDIDHVLSSQRSNDGTIVIVIDPAAMPAGTELSIGYKPESSPGTKDRVRFALVKTDAKLRCEDFA
jgi:hypothetical protein